MHRIAQILLAMAALVAVPASKATDATACQQITFPLYSLDRNSPFVDPNQPFAAGDALRVPGPAIIRPAAFFGLNHPLDDLDGLSLLDATTDGTQSFLLLFSVDRQSRGIVGPDPNLVAAGYPFNVLDQANKGQAAADAFAGTGLFTRFGPLPAPLTAPRTGGNNTLVINQGDAGGIDYAVPPNISPSAGTSVTPENNVNGGAGAGAPAPLPLTGRGGGDKGQRPRGVAPRILAYTAQANSPSLNTLPGTASGADIYLAADPADPNGPGFAQMLYAAPFQLGLMPSDDIDALMLFENGDLAFQPNQDQVIFSLARGSPTLQKLGLSPADIFTTTPTGLEIYALAGDLGLGLHPDPDNPGEFIRDNIDMLDYIPCVQARDCILAWGIGRPCACPGDANGDGVVNISDLGVVLANFGSTGAAPEQGDANGDSNVNISDVGVVLANFGNACP